MSERIDEFPNAAGGPLVKICGLTRPQDAALALNLGATFLGLILTTKSPRHISETAALALVQEIRNTHGDDVRFVGVFVDEPGDHIAALYDRLNLFAIQAHGNVDRLNGYIPVPRTIPAVAIKDESSSFALTALSPDYPAVLADAFSPGKAGGTGKVFNHELVRHLFDQRRIFLAGGLNPDNIDDIIHKLQPGPWPYVFDLSSGVEDSPGVKSETKLRGFFDIYHRHFPRSEG